MKTERPECGGWTSRGRANQFSSEFDFLVSNPWSAGAQVARQRWDWVFTLGIFTLTDLWKEGLKERDDGEGVGNTIFSK